MIVFDRSFWLGILLSSGSIFVLAHGLGAGSITTAILLATTTAVLILSAPWRGCQPDAADAVYFALISFVALSFIVNGWDDNRKELALLLLTLSAYPAARLMLSVDRTVLAGVLIAVVALGTLVTIPALTEQWSNLHGKPLVFGLFDSAATQFATTLCVLLTLLASQNLTRRQAAWIAVAAFVPIAVYTASMVRFALLAMLIALGAVFLIGPRTQRVQTGIIIVAAVIAMIAGSAMRSSATSVYIGQISKMVGVNLGPAFEPPPDLGQDAQLLASAAPPAIVVPPPIPRTDCPAVDTNNSIDIRRRLLAEAANLLPVAGLTGIGFNGFDKRSCLPGYPVHNSFLQGAIEFGWPACLAMIALVVLGLRPRAFALARSVPIARFVYCFLIFEVLMSAVYGRTSRDNMLLLALGLAAAVVQKRTSQAVNLASSNIQVARATEGLQPE
ncbi:hypothetical protein [Bradyrhizobium mercantei]|uniref:hypothetical protein n=1 Tax=Bradyrhizobium mercantei TaxID=1904807 RepID=UPI000978211D|nr:hypothetical protein [Bradyrhizobium mercantei]